MIHMDDHDIWGAIGCLVFVGIAIGAVLAFAVPWLWRLVKPFIHAVTGS